MIYSANMNHFAHLALAQPTVESTVGNLLGDFARGVDLQNLPADILAGLHNHRAVDRFTDAHPLVSDLRNLFSPPRRRFAGIALDIYFDHLLIVHWSRFDQRDVETVIGEFYVRMRAGQELMPGADMRRVTQRMIEYDWFGSYRNLENIAESLDRVACRIRFANRFDNAIEDLAANQETIEAGFLEFYPDLQQHVAELGLETA